LLHLEIGMVNHLWDEFKEWVDNVVEVVPSIEQDARKQVQDAKDKLDLAMEQKKQADATINISIREKSGTVILIKAQLRRRNLENERKNELQMQLMLLNTFICNLKEQLKYCKDNFKSCQMNRAESKKKLAIAEKKEASQR
jgi:ElaB/YqjD/DUF883 family membrane-anchored ribosome-binding protein